MLREKKKTSMIREARKRGNLRKEEMSNWIKYETEPIKVKVRKGF